MANFDVVILGPATATNPEGKTVVSVQAGNYEESERGYLLFYKDNDNRKVATFKTWDYVLRVQDSPP